MIIKIHESAQSISSPIKYNMKKVNEGNANIVANINMPEDITPNNYMDFFARFDRANIRTELTSFHVSFNPHPNDNVNEEDIRVMIREYMEEMGYGEQPYIIFKHEDIEREHYHVISHRVKLSTGKKINDSFEKRRSRRLAVHFEKKYNLVPSEEHTLEAKNLNRHIMLDIRNINNTALKYNVKNFNEYKNVCDTLGCRVEEYLYVDKKNDKEESVYYYQKHGEQTGMIPAKDCKISCKKIKERFDNESNNKQNIGYKNRLKGIALSCKKNATSLLHFERMLKKREIDIRYNINDEDRITGVYFIDHHNKVIYKGSELSKMLSANAINLMSLEDKERKVISSIVYTPQNTIASKLSCLAHTPIIIHNNNVDYNKEKQAEWERSGKTNNIELTTKL